MSKLQRRLVSRLAAYDIHSYARGSDLARWCGVGLTVVQYHMKKLIMRGVVISNKGPDGGYALKRKHE